MLILVLAIWAVPVDLSPSAAVPLPLSLAYFQIQKPPFLIVPFARWQSPDRAWLCVYRAGQSWFAALLPVREYIVELIYRPPFAIGVNQLRPLITRQMTSS
ncbi:hypothetical protein [Pseudomonas sp. NPDC088444]|uniref:hypothetical protein n=1 Tax=Pseudomonas sp. NPDC088444 TaxID=3364456 RepID=UPI00384EB63E